MTRPELHLGSSVGITSAHWPHGLDWHIDVPAGNAFGGLARSATRFPDRPVLHYYGLTTNYAQLLHRAEALAGFLQHLGVRKGDRILINMQNTPQFVVAFQAILRADAVVVPVNPMNISEEIAYLAKDSGARIAIVGDELLGRFSSLVPGLLDHVISVHYADAAQGSSDQLPDVMRTSRAELSDLRYVDFEVAIAAGHRPGPMLSSASDPAVIPYSSGTTGRPKGCVHSHGAVSFTAIAQVNWYGLDHTDVMTSFMPLFHVAGMQASMSAGIFAGAALVLMTRWNRMIVPVLLQRHHVTWWSAAPTMIVDVLASPEFTPECLDTVRILTGGGATLPAALAERVSSEFGLSFCEGYGLTETISATHINPPEHPKAQCMGLPIQDTHARIVDPETLADLPQGEPGEILVAGPQIMLSYWNRPEDTAAAFVTWEGKIYLRTGDLGYVDSEGYYFMVDRLKRMINSSGYKVWPAEVEALLYRHPAVSDCCVISSPDAYRGETVKALITLKPGQEDKITSNDITDFAREVMSSYKIPRLIEFVEQLPHSDTRKIDWRALQNAEWERHK